MSELEMIDKMMLDGIQNPETEEITLSRLLEYGPGIVERFPTVHSKPWKVQWIQTCLSGKAGITVSPMLVENTSGNLDRCPAKEILDALQRISALTEFIKEKIRVPWNGKDNFSYSMLTNDEKRTFLEQKIGVKRFKNLTEPAKALLCEILNGLRKGHQPGERIKSVMMAYDSSLREYYDNLFVSLSKEYFKWTTNKRGDPLWLISTLAKMIEDVEIRKGSIEKPDIDIDAIISWCKAPRASEDVIRHVITTCKAIMDDMASPGRTPLDLNEFRDMFRTLYVLRQTTNYRRHKKEALDVIRKAISDSTGPYQDKKSAGGGIAVSKLSKGLKALHDAVETSGVLCEVGAPFTFSERREQYNIDHGQCTGEEHTGERFTPFEETQMDHYPASRDDGGKNGRTLCFDCHTKKHNPSDQTLQ